MITKVFTFSPAISGSQALNAAAAHVANAVTAPFPSHFAQTLANVEPQLINPAISNAMEAIGKASRLSEEQTTTLAEQLAEISRAAAEAASPSTKSACHARSVAGKNTRGQRGQVGKGRQVELEGTRTFAKTVMIYMLFPFHGETARSSPESPYEPSH